MERYYSQIVGTEILTETGLSAGRIFDVVIDPERGKVAGFLLTPHGEKVLSTADMLFWSQRIIIHDVEDIIETEEIIKIQKILDKKIPVIKNKVLSKSGEYLGYVFDYTIDDKLFMMSKILVAKKILGVIFYDEKIICFNDILEIKKEAIIVKNPLRLIPVKKRKAHTAARELKIDPTPAPSCKSLF